MKKPISLAVLSAISIGIMAMQFETAMAIGFVTKPIEIKNAMKGGIYEEKLYLVNNESRTADASLQGTGQIKDWVKFYSMDDASTSIDILAVSTSTSIYFKARFEIPENAANGTYEGKVKVLIEYKDPAGIDESKANVAQSMERPVKITVSDKEEIKFSVSVIPDSYDPGLNEPLKVRLLYDNQSNVPIAPEARVKIKKGDNILFSLNFPYPDGVEPVKPGEIKEVPTLTIPLSLEPRYKYMAVLDFAQNGNIYYTDDFPFNYGYDNPKVLGAETKAGETFKDGLVMVGGASFLVLAVWGAMYAASRKKLSGNSKG